MSVFRFSHTPIDTTALHAELANPESGGYTSFEGWVRNHNEGHKVRHLEYEAFEPLAVKEGERIVAEAIKRFGIERAACVHRVGDLAIGDMAVWVGASARHRDEALVTGARTPRELYDELKARHPFSLAPEMLRVAVNTEFGDWSQQLADGDAVVFIPPVAGG